MAKSRTSGILFAGILGLAAGVAIGLLLAPEKGSKTRKKLVRKLSEVSENVKQELTDELEKLRSVFPGDAEEETANKKAKTTRKTPTS